MNFVGFDAIGELGNYILHSVLGQYWCDDSGVVSVR